MNPTAFMRMADKCTAPCTCPTPGLADAMKGTVDLGQHLLGLVLMALGARQQRLRAEAAERRVRELEQQIERIQSDHRDADGDSRGAEDGS